MGLFGKTKNEDPRELVNGWRRTLRKEGSCLDRQIRHIKQEEDKVLRSIKEAAKRNDMTSCRILAREVMASRKAVNRIYTAKANLNSVELQMTQQMAQVRLAGGLQKSTEVMKAMQNLFNITKVSETMRNLTREMMRAGIIEEMLEETMTSVLDVEEETEEEEQEAIAKILAEITQKQKSTTKEGIKLGEESLNLPEPGSGSIAIQPDISREDPEMDDMQSRLSALRN